jgi:methylglyoxal synthase
MNPRKRIALVAHDNKKADLLDWVRFNRAILLEHDLLATGTTGGLVEEELGIAVVKPAERTARRRPTDRREDRRRPD